MFFRRSAAILVAKSVAIHKPRTAAGASREILEAPGTHAFEYLAAFSRRRNPRPAPRIRLERDRRGDEAALVERKLRRHPLRRVAVFDGRPVLYGHAD